MWDSVIVLKAASKTAAQRSRGYEIEKGQAKALRPESLKQGTMYTLEKTLNFKVAK